MTSRNDFHFLLFQANDAGNFYEGGEEEAMDQDDDDDDDDEYEDGRSEQGMIFGINIGIYFARALTQNIIFLG